MRKLNSTAADYLFVRSSVVVYYGYNTAGWIFLNCFFLLLKLEFDDESNQALEPKLELLDMKEDLHDLYKEGMIWTKEDGPAPDGFTLYTMDSGTTVLRRKRQRNLQKLGKLYCERKASKIGSETRFGRKNSLKLEIPQVSEVFWPE